VARAVAEAMEEIAVRLEAGDVAGKGHEDVG
jgi:hypothetical protein